MIDWNSVFATTLTGSAFLSVITVVIGFIFKSISNQWLSRDIERYKSQLQLTNEKEIDQFRSELQQTVFEHQTRYVRLHEKRGELIAGLYTYMVETEEKFASMTSIAEWEGDPFTREDKIKRAAESARVLTSYYFKNKIYFDEELCNKLDGFLVRLRQIFIDFRMSSIDHTGELWIKANEQMASDIPIIKHEIEREFRKLLGIQLEPSNVP